MRRQAPKIRKLDNHEELAPKVHATWVAVWGAMSERGPGRGFWQRPDTWADEIDGNSKTIYNLLTTAHRQGLVRKRLRRDEATGRDHVYFARTDQVAKSWSAKELAAFDQTTWRWQ
jgi:hypothetical protein